MEKSDDELELTVPKDNKRRGIDRLSFKFPFASGELSGQHALLAIIVLCFASPVVAAIYYHHVQNEKWIERRNEITGANTRRLIKLEEFIERNEQTQEAMIYILSLSPDKREKLQLDKPQKIRDLERGNFGRDYNGRQN